MTRKHFASVDTISIRFVFFVFVLVKGFYKIYTKAHCCIQIAKIRDMIIHLIIKTTILKVHKSC